jgi:hypothetical protein
LVEEASIPILGRFVNLELEVVHHTFGFLTPGFDRASLLGDDAEPLSMAFVNLGDERGLAKLGVGDAALPV